MMRILSPWFPGSIKPVREGLYLVERWPGDDIVLLDFDPPFWFVDGKTARIYRWRGLAFDPTAARAIDIEVVDKRGYVCKKFQCAWLVPVPDEVPL